MTAFATLLLLVLTACEPCRHYNRLQVAAFAGATERKPGTGDRTTVKVFWTLEEVKQSYQVVGLLTCEGDVSEEAAILNAMCYRAADMGADGLLLAVPPPNGIQTSPTVSQRIDVRIGWAALLGDNNSTRRAFRAQVIKCSGGPAASVPAPAVTR